MNAKRATRTGLALILVVVAVAALALVPGLAAALGGLVADLWITVMAALAGLLGGLLG